MEIWGLLAAGATAVVSEALAPDIGRAGGRGQPAERGTWRATVAHLGAAGFDVSADLDSDDPVVSVHPYADRDLAALDAFSAAELQAIAAARRSGVPWEFEAVHPLYDQRHGSGVERFGLRRCFNLGELSRDDGRDGPVAVHPWTGTPLTRLPVLPPEFRGFGFDDLDRLYIGIGALIAPPIPPRRGQTKNEQAGWQGSAQDRTDLQQLIDRLLGGWRVGKRHELDTGIYHRLAHKRGLLRRYLLGTSRNASARGVIVPDPDLPIEAVGLPATAYDALIGTSSDSVVIINRQPTLRPANLIALRARRIEGHAITLHPQLLEPLAGDFDGDTIAVHRPVTALARNQAWAMLRPARNMRNPAHGRLAVKSDLDLALGHQLQPTGQELRDRVELALTSAPNDPCVGLAALQSELWRAASGWSFGLLELPRLSPEADESPVDTLHRSLARPEFADLVTVIAAGAVKPDVLTALLLEHRPAPSFNPFLPALLPGGCFLDGLVDDPYAAKARSGQARLAEKKLLTPLAGAVTKSLVEIAYEVVISVPDCGSLQRGPLSCAYADPCQACYGTVPGESEPAAIGRRVGILAGMVIGERATQLAMKTFHAGGSQTVDVAELRALLGHGASRLLGDRARRRSGKPIGLQKYLARVEARTPEDLQPVVDLVVASLQGDVAAVHVQVMLRQLWEARALPGPAGRWPSLAARAEAGGRDGLVLATSRGSVEMINAARAGEPRQGARLGLMVQGGR